MTPGVTVTVEKPSVSSIVQWKAFSVGVALGAILVFAFMEYKCDYKISQGSAQTFLKFVSINKPNAPPTIAKAKTSSSGTGLGNLAQLSFANSQDGLRDDTTLVDSLQKKVRVLVWVMTSHRKLKMRAIHVVATWGRRPDHIVYIAAKDNLLPSAQVSPYIEVNVTDGWLHLTQKTHAAYRHLYTHHLQDADWFMKADDDAYVIVENLAYFLADKNASEPVFFGQRMKIATDHDAPFASGGAGYVLSKAAVRLLATKGTDPGMCVQTGAHEDSDVSKCLLNIGARFGNGDVDEYSKGRGVFFALSPESLLYDLPNEKIHWYRYHGYNGGIEEISRYPVTFHRLRMPEMYMLDLFLYHARPFGIQFCYQGYGNCRR